jgi:hypothetical protein
VSRTFDRSRNDVSADAAELGVMLLRHRELLIRHIREHLLHTLLVKIKKHLSTTAAKRFIEVNIGVSGHVPVFIAYRVKF